MYVTHVKPGELDAVMTEVAALASGHTVRALAGRQRITLAD